MDASWTWVETCVGGQTDTEVTKKIFLGRLSFISSRPKWAHVSASHRKSSQVIANARKTWPNGVASRPKPAFNLRLLVTPFGQDLRCRMFRSFFDNLIFTTVLLRFFIDRKENLGSRTAQTVVYYLTNQTVWLSTSAAKKDFSLNWFARFFFCEARLLFVTKKAFFLFSMSGELL